MDRAWELFVKFFLLLLFGPVIIFYAINMIAALLGVVVAFFVSILPVVIVGAFGVGIVVGLFYLISRGRRPHSSRINNGHSQTKFSENTAVRRPRWKKHGHDDGG